MIPSDWGINKFFDNFPPDMKKVKMSAWHFPLLSDVGTDHPTVIGTAFAIDERTLVTAKHVLKEMWEATQPTRLGRTITAFQDSAYGKSLAWRITGSIVHKKADLAILFVDNSSNRNNPDLLVPPWKVRADAPNENEWVAAFGNIEGRASIVSKNPSGGGEIEVGVRGQLTFGVVKKVYDVARDSTLLPCPCFEVGASLSPGMSGGPVFDMDGAICGIVSRGFEGVQSSHIVTLWPSLQQIYKGPFGSRL